MKPATPKARTLKLKLEALAKQGVNGEATAAQAKLARLVARYDFNAPIKQDLRDLFKGTFCTAYEATPVCRLDTGALDVASFAKWAIEARCKIPCLFRDGQLYAQATPKTAKQLTTIATAMCESFGRLWTQFRTAPGTNPLDRSNFMRGLYDGMLDEALTGSALPKRAGQWKPAKAKKKSVAAPVGLQLHPYQVAVDLGRQIRFCVPLEEISNQLTNAIRGEIPDNNP